MAETEVESILREIRERVLAQQGAAQQAGTGSAMTNAGNGAGDSGASAQLAGQTANKILADENLSLINSYLTTTARAWDRLPPLVSNRSGLSARVELWMKRNLKRATRWYAWEQVNFNAAVHHALREMLSVLTAHEHELRRLRAQIAEGEARRIELEQYQALLTTQLSELNARLRTESNAQQRATETHQAQVDARFAELVNELREGNERLQDQQRVCFKQLALETSEAAVLEDRARRKTQALMEELQRRLSKLEKGKK
jgi:predicted transcriptional regulator